MKHETAMTPDEIHSEVERLNELHKEREELTHRADRVNEKTRQLAGKLRHAKLVNKLH